MKNPNKTSRTTRSPLPGTAPSPANSCRPAATPHPPLDRAVAKKLLELWRLPKKEQPQAIAAWLTSAGSPKLNAQRQEKVKALLDYSVEEVKKMTPHQRAAARAEGIALRAKASRKAAAKPEA